MECAVPVELWSAATPAWSWRGQGARTEEQPVLFMITTITRVNEYDYFLFKEIILRVSRHSKKSYS